MVAILDRYILRQICKPILTAMGIGLLVLLAERMVRLLDVTLGKRNSFGVVFELLAYLVPHYLGLAIPVALFLGLLLGFNKMSRDSEIDAFMASGVGLSRLLRPVMILVLLLAVVSFAIFGWLQPHTRFAYRAVIFSVKTVDVFYLAEEGVFMQAGSRTFILDRLSRANGSFERMFLFDDRGSAGAETITAQSGKLISSAGSQRPVLHLERGHRLAVPEWPGFAASDPAASAVVGEFNAADMPLGTLNRKLIRPRGEDERELTLPELLRQRLTPPKGTTVNKMTAELHRRLVNVASIIVLPMLALPFSLGQRRNLRAYRFGVALAILIAYYEVIQQGAVMTQSYGYSPYLTMWLPYATLFGFSLWRFLTIAYKLRTDGWDPAFDRMSEIAQAIRRRVLPASTATA
jgi:lipopolysaccharide export system permease protein